jgi:hypothetical protein
MLVPALAAVAIQGQVNADNVETALLPHPVHELLNYRAVEVDNPATTPTNQMVVLTTASHFIVAAAHATEAPFLYQPLFPEQVQAAVYRGETDVNVPFRSAAI